MKAVIQNFKTGELVVEEVPPPALMPAGVLIEVRRSVISLGTERAVIAMANKGPIGKARQRPDLARKVLNKAKQEGFLSTYKVVKNLMASPIPLGYSCSGVVAEVGAEVRELEPGDRIAAYGLSFANHAELDYVPRNLTVKIPDHLSFDSAAFVGIGAIAMQGVRLAGLELGDRVAVLGLGMIGLITAQLAIASGASVIAFEPDPERGDLARSLGIERVVSNPAELEGAVLNFTGGHGADAVLVAAATRSHELMRTAAEISRLKGRVVIVGDVGLNLERRPFFDKEVSIVISRSTGPGRFDPAYENRGTDYPLPYVRWTQQRNASSFLELVAQGRVLVDPLISHHFPIAEAKDAYRIVTGGADEKAVAPIAIVLDYEAGGDIPRRVELGAAPARPVDGSLSMGVIGAGQFARGVLLPAFAAEKVSLGAFCTASGITAKTIAQRYGASFCTSDPREIIKSDSLDAVLIATRHDQHAPLALEATAAGKAVFVEKPLALVEEHLVELTERARTSGTPRLMVGYNRRFSPLAVRCRELFASCVDPLYVFYRVNAGQLPSDSWVYDPVQGGGRILGEVCHFVDMLLYLTGSRPVRVNAEPVLVPGSPDPHRDSVSVTVRMENGSVGVIHYLTSGDPSLPKEYLEVYGGRRTAVLDNYRSLTTYQGNKRRRRRLRNQAKGFSEEVAAFARAVREGGPMPIDFEDLIAVSQTCFLILRSLEKGGPVPYRAPGVGPE